MTKKILMHCGFAPFDNPSIHDIISRKVKIGDNTGNFFFPNGVMKAILKEDIEIIPNYYKLDFCDNDIEKINEEYSYFLMPLADAFRHGNEKVLIQLTNFINRLRIPCVVIGVGLRASYEQHLEDYSFDPIVIDFVNAVRKKGTKVGVRGRFTASYLEKLGFVPEKDFTVIGCPSMYLNGADISVRKPIQFRKICINANTLADENVNAFIKRTVEKYDDVSIVQQKYEEVLDIYLGRDRIKPYSIYGEKLYKRLLKKDKVLCFSNIHSWIEYLRKQDVCLNTRFHGTVAAVLAGTPSIIIPIDSRMRELVEYHHLPSVPLESINENTDFEDIIQHTDFSIAENYHLDNLTHFVEFMNTNGLETIYDDGILSPCYYDEMISKICWKDFERCFTNIGFKERVLRITNSFFGRAFNKLGLYKRRV